MGSRAPAPFHCPRCGGEVAAREGAQIVHCRFCGVAMLVRSPDGRLRYSVPAGVRPRQAAAAVREQLRGEGVPGRRAGPRARLRAVSLFYVPYWRFQATAVGRLRGTRRLRRRLPEPGPEMGGTPPVREVVRVEMVDKEIREVWGATLSACPAEDLGIPTLSSRRQRSAGMEVTRPLSGLRGLRLLDDRLFGEGTVLDALVPEAVARQEAERLFQSWADGRGFEVRNRELRLLRLQQRAYLLYYPVYRVSFRAGRRLYRATVDGVDGSVIQARLPADPTPSLVAGLASLLGGAALVTAPVRLALLPPETLPEMAGLRGSPRFWAGAALGLLALAILARLLPRRLRLDRERVVRG